MSGDALACCAAALVRIAAALEVLAGTVTPCNYTVYRARNGGTIKVTCIRQVGHAGTWHLSADGQDYE